MIAMECNRVNENFSTIRLCLINVHLISPGFNLQGLFINNVLIF